MMIEDAEKLIDLQQNGHLVVIDDHPYADSPVKRIYRDEDGNIVYDSHVYEGRELARVLVECVTVAKIIKDWRTS